MLTERHLELFAKLHRSRPDLAPLLELSQFEDGCESIEAVSRRAHEFLLAHGLDNGLFSVLCELNAERVHAAIVRQLDEEGLPLDEESILGDLFARLHRWYFDRKSPSPLRAAELESAAFEAMGRETTVMRGLAEVVRAIIAERIRMLAASSVPMPSAPTPAVAVSDSLLFDAARALDDKRYRLRVADLRRWVTFALLGLPGMERRLIHLRNRRELTIAAIAERVGLTPFDAGVRLKRAIVALHDEMNRILRLHESGESELTDETVAELPPNPGRLLELRPNRSTPKTEQPPSSSLRPPTEPSAGRPPSEREEDDDE